MVAVAQLVEPWIVIPVVVGSSPISHPNIPIKNNQLLLAELIGEGNFAAGNDKIGSIGITVNELTEIQLQAMQWSSELEGQSS